MRRRPALALIVLLVAALTVMAAAQPDLAKTIDASLMNLERAEHHIRYRFGLPLRGMPDLQRLDERLASGGFKLGLPILVRIFKRESDLEIWMKKGERFELFATYPVCRWAGRLGPKKKRGDRQVPEGFYTVSKAQLNPNSRWHRSFNIGYPNILDRSYKRTGDFIMVHGGCSSAGCIAVTNEAIDEVWAIVTAALGANQKRFQVQVFPFRMTEFNLALYGDHPSLRDWRDLKRGYDLFENNQVPPRITMCQGRYQAEPGSAGSDGSDKLERRCSPALAKAD